MITINYRYLKLLKVQLSILNFYIKCRSKKELYTAQMKKLKSVMSPIQDVNTVISEALLQGK